MSEGTASAQLINNSLTGDPLLLHRVDASQLQAPVRVVPGRIEEHPADENQGRGLDHLSKKRTLSDVLKDAAMFPLLMLGWLIWGGDE